jgi:hypothetical protein
MRCEAAVPRSCEGCELGVPLRHLACAHEAQFKSKSPTISKQATDKLSGYDNTESEHDAQIQTVGEKQAACSNI